MPNALETVTTSLKTHYSSLAVISIGASVVIGVVTVVLVVIDLIKNPPAPGV